MQMRVSSTDSLFSVAMTRGERDESRHYGEREAEHARAALRRFIAECGTQTAAEKRLSVSQSTLSRSLSLSQQPSLKLLISLSLVTGQSLNAILGLESSAAPDLADEVARRVSDILRPELAAREPSSILSMPNAQEFAARNSRRWSREVAAMMTVQYGDERKRPDEWVPIFKAAKKLHKGQQTVRKNRAEKKAAERPGPHRPHKATG